MRIDPYLTFDGRCEEAFKLYESVLNGRIIMLMRYSDAPASDEAHHVPEDWRTKIMHGCIMVGDHMIMGTDCAPQYQAKPQGMSISIQVRDPAEGERMFTALAEGGTIQMPFAETFWAERFGMVTDRFGTPWMINCEGNKADPTACGKLVFYTNPMSRGRVVRWMLEEIGVPYETVVLAYGPEMKSDTYLAMNPMGKVPTLRHGDRIVTECAAICAYMADAFPDAGLAPPRHERADYYRWLFFAAGPLEAAVFNRSIGAAPADQKQQGMAGYGTYDLTVSTLAKAVSARPFIAGDRFTAADVYVGTHIGWGLMMGHLPALPEFEAYWNRLSGRPAWKRATELDDALEQQQ